MAERKFEPCVAFDGKLLHLREEGGAFTLCSRRSLQPLQRDDKRRRSLPTCSTCEEFAEDYAQVGKV